MGMCGPTFIVTATHKETGISATLDNCISQGQTRDEMTRNAIRIARARVWAANNPAMVRTDRCRTYHTSPWGTWTKDHRTGERKMNEFLGEAIE